MIISASRRSDIPAFFSDWFINRIKERYVFVRNPMNIHQISKIDLSPEVVDCIVFWTKNPLPLINKLDYLNNYNYYFQYTLNSYTNDLEVNLPTKNELIDAFKILSDSIGREKVIWRYDPILINKKYTIEYHELHFEKLAKSLKDYTEKCVISFVDFYRNVNKKLNYLGI